MQTHLEDCQEGSQLNFLSGSSHQPRLQLCHLDKQMNPHLGHRIRIWSILHMLCLYLGGQVKLVHVVVDLCQDVLQAQTLQSFQLAHLAGRETNSIFDQNCIDNDSIERHL